MKRLLAIFLLALCSACGSAPPEITAVSLTDSAVRRGEQFFANLEASDLDGDFNGGLVQVELRGPEDTELKTEVNVFGIPEGVQRTSMSVSLRIVGTAPLGPYDIELVLVDESGNDSETAKAQVQLVQR